VKDNQNNTAHTAYHILSPFIFIILCFTSMLHAHW